MLLIFLDWLYILCTAFLLGFAVFRLVERLSGYKQENIFEIFFVGLAAATVYAQVFSLFSGVGAAANVILLLFCAAVLILWRKSIAELIVFKAFKSSGHIYKVILALLTLIWCYCTSRGYMHYDSDLYHAQSIRWIEEYGVVAGLGNIHVRFAYNSSFFALSALYSMRDIAGQSLHAVNGFIALLLSMEIASAFKAVKSDGSKNIVRKCACIGAFYYLTLIYGEIVSPASDYCVMCVVFYIVIRWIAHIEEKEKSVAPYAMLCVVGVFAVTLKLTAGVILLLVIKPAYMLMKEKRVRETAAYILMGVLVLAPWIVRTAVISGYLLYPFPALDVLNVDWKIPAAEAANDAAEIRTWARGLYDASLVDVPAAEWFLPWFKNTLSALEKLFIIADIVCVAVTILLCVGFAIAVCRKDWGSRALRVCSRLLENGSDFADKLLTLSTVAASYVFWQLSAPLLRYGYAYVFLLIALTAGILIEPLAKRRALFSRALLCAAAVLLAAKAYSLVGFIASYADKPYYVRQQDYGSYSLLSYEIDGVMLYYPESGDRVGYEYFPAIPRAVDVELRGDGIEDGFRMTE